MQIKLIFTTKVLHWASFWKWEFLELGNGHLAHPLILNLSCSTCLYFQMQVFVFQYLMMLNLGCLKVLWWVIISLNKGLMLETQVNMVFEGWEGYSSLVYTWVEQQIQALCNKYFLVPTVRRLLITVMLMRDSQMKTYKKNFFKITNVLLKWCLHIKIYVQAKLSILQRRRGGGRGSNCCFFCKDENLKRKPVMSPTRWY